MNAQGRPVRADALVTVIRDASEKAWCAGWLIESEAALWARLEQWRVHGAASSWGLLEGAELAIVLARLDDLSNSTGMWATLGHDGPHPVTLQEWLTELWPKSASRHVELAGQPPMCGRFVETDSQGAAACYMARCGRTAGHLGDCVS